MITYRFDEKNQVVRVLLDGKPVGEIRPVREGFQYFPKNHPGGEVFPTLMLCKRSLE